MPECRNKPCTCTSDEKWSCLTSQWNEFDRPVEEEQEKNETVQFKKAIEKGDLTKVKELLPKIKFKH